MGPQSSEGGENGGGGCRDTDLEFNKIYLTGVKRTNNKEAML